MKGHGQNKEKEFNFFFHFLFSNDEKLHYGTIICSLGVRYKFYCSNIVRTMLYEPTEVCCSIVILLKLLKTVVPVLSLKARHTTEQSSENVASVASSPWPYQNILVHVVGELATYRRWFAIWSTLTFPKTSLDKPLSAY